MSTLLKLKIKQMVDFTCMVIDDDEDHHVFFNIALKDQAVKVACTYYTEAKIALNELVQRKVNKPDVIFLDLNMPQLSGLGFLKILKAHSGFSDIPVIIYSTSDSNQDIIEAKQSGALDYLVKPENIDEMIIQLRTVFEDLNQAHFS